MVDNRKPELTLSPWPLLVSAENAAKMLGISKSHLYALHKTDKLGPKPVSHLGRRNLWRVIALEKWVENGCPPRWQWEKMQAPAPPKARDSDGA